MIEAPLGLLCVTQTHGLWAVLRCSLHTPFVTAGGRLRVFRL